MIVLKLIILIPAALVMCWLGFNFLSSVLVVIWMLYEDVTEILFGEKS